MDINAILGNLGTAAPLNSFGDYVKPGRHTCEVLKYGYKTTDNNKQIIFAELIVRESTGGHAVGDIVSVHWRMTLTGWEHAREMSRAASFIDALYPGLSANDRTARGAAMIQNQAARGRIVVVVGKVTFSKKTKEEAARAGRQLTAADGFTVAEFEPVDPAANTDAAVAQRRAELDRTRPLPQAPTAAPSYGHAMQAAPAPAQPPGYGYGQPAAQGYAQPAPVQAQPGYAAPAGYGQPAPTGQPAPAPSFLPPGSV